MDEPRSTAFRNIPHCGLRLVVSNPFPDRFGMCDKRGIWRTERIAVRAVETSLPRFVSNRIEFMTRTCDRWTQKTKTYFFRTLGIGLSIRI
jgi:hypothetical protein